MIEEILPNLYRIEVPLPRNPLKALNSYILKGDGRFLIVDTGMNREECLEAMTSGLKELGVDLDRADIFVTHLHADHSGQSGVLARPQSRVYLSTRDMQIFGARPQRREMIRNLYSSCGFPEPELTRAIELNPGRRYGAKKDIAFTPVKEGDLVEIGDYSFRCIETPGHTPGHMCLYDDRKKVLLAGDHILIDITPNISYWPELDDSIKHYLASLDKVYALEVDLVLPGHRRIVNDHRQRIRELRAHHELRANEALAALESGEQNVFQVAPYITWDIECDSWQDFPPQQKWFAFGETLAHLEYLEGQGKVRRIERDRQTTFALP